MKLMKTGAMSIKVTFLFIISRRDRIVYNNEKTLVKKLFVENWQEFCIIWQI